MADGCASKYLAALYDDCDGLIEFRALSTREGAQTCFARIDDLDTMRAFARANAGRSLYHAMATRRDASSGTLENAAHLPCLYSDLDVQNEKHPTAPTEAEARASLARCALPPSVVVHSGGGLYPLWLLREPMDLREPAEVAQAYDLLRRLTAYLSADPSAAEPARILRVPGTRNHKYPHTPIVTIETFDPSRRYSLRELDEWLPTIPREQTRQQAPADGGPRTYGAGERNAALFRLARSHKSKGIPAATSLEMLRAFNRTQCDPPHDEAEVQRVNHSAYHQADRPDFAADDPARSSAPEQAAREIHLTPASQITVRPVRWLWDERIALGTLALMGGREGVGKTICAYTLAADITRGRLLGVYAGMPRAVIVAATEDSWEHTIVPRLMAARADLARVYRVDVVTGEGTDTGLSLPRDLVALERVVREVQAALIILDPLLSRLDTQLDTHKDAEVRVALEPLVTLANTTDACVLGLIHVNKSASSDVLTMLMGSRAFAAVARAVLFVMADPEDESRRLLGQAKNNLGRVDLPTLTFRIVGAIVATTDEGEVWTGKLEWLGESDRSIRDAVAAAAESTGTRTATSEAGDWLHDYLMSQGGTAESSRAKTEGKQAGHSADSLKRVLSRLRIVCDSRGFPRRTYWTVPTQSEHDPTPAELPQSEQAPGETCKAALTALTEGNLSKTTNHSWSTVGAVGAVGAVGGDPARDAPTDDAPADDWETAV